MSRADVLMRKIREDISKIESQKGATTQEEIDVMEFALIDLTRHINALGDIPVEGVLKYKDDLIGIMALMDNLEQLIESAKTSSRSSVLDMIQKIKAQASYGKKD